MSIISKKATDSAIHLGINFKLRRQAYGYSQSTLARLSDVSTSTVKRLEKGDPGVSLGAMLKVAHRLHCADKITFSTDPFNSPEISYKIIKEGVSKRGK